MRFLVNTEIVLNIGLILLTTVGLAVEESKTEVNIYVKPKQFRGLSKQIDNKKVNIFLGIPYAKPPTGDLRFKKPEPFGQSDQIINANKWPNPCKQLPVILQTVFKPLVNNTNFSEDCLYLNIWSPVDEPEQPPVLKPVLFWIHGGGFYSGASNIENTDGEILAVKADVVLVTFNYRLGWFGFLYAGSDDAPGNMGLWDQALALKWVNENIVFFGGDPNRITIIGEEAGSQSVSMHLLSPITRNLFRNAIMMSGSALTDGLYKDSTSAKKMWLNIAEDFGCEQHFLNGSVDCLRAINTEKLIESSFDKRYKTDINVIKPFIIFGDEFLPRKPAEMLRIGDFKRNIRLLVGTTVDEGSYVLTTIVDSNRYDVSNPHNMSKSEAKLEIQNIFRRFFPNSSIMSEDIYRLYVAHLPDADYELIRRSVGVALGDFIRTCPTVLFAKHVFAGEPDNSRVYQYLWSAKYMQSWHGSDHGADVGFFFGSPYRPALNSATDEMSNKKRISLRAMQMIGHFARFGTPPSQEGIEWQSYYKIDDKVINPYFEFTKRYFSATDFSNGFKYECDYLWTKYNN